MTTKDNAVQFPRVIAALGGGRPNKSFTQEELDEMKKNAQARYDAFDAQHRLRQNLYAAAGRAGFRVRMYRRTGKYMLIDPATKDRIVVNGRYFMLGEELLNYLRKLPKIRLSNAELRRTIADAAEQAGLRSRQHRRSHKFIITDPKTCEVCLNQESSVWMDRATAEEALAYLRKQPRVTIQNDSKRLRVYVAAKRAGLKGGKNKHIGKFVISDPITGSVLFESANHVEAAEFCKQQLQNRPASCRKVETES